MHRAKRRLQQQRLNVLHCNSSCRRKIAEQVHVRHARVPPYELARHITTQAQLMRHLRLRAWTDDGTPRVMVDAGCHAGHGPNRNMSDALLWLDLFGSAAGQRGSSLVAALDVFEDFALDVRYRLEAVPPYASMRAVEKRVFTLALSSSDDQLLDFTTGARQHLSCCIDQGWCGPLYSDLERKKRSDHVCKLTRMRLGLTAPDERVPHAAPSGLVQAGERVAARPHAPPSSDDCRGGASAFCVHAPGMYDYYSVMARHGKAAVKTKYNASARAAMRYLVPTMRMDTFWRRHLGRRRVHFWKVDVDTDWRKIGMEGLLQERAFAVMTIEVDGHWGDYQVPRDCPNANSLRLIPHTLEWWAGTVECHTHGSAGLARPPPRLQRLPPRRVRPARARDCASALGVPRPPRGRPPRQRVEWV